MKALLRRAKQDAVAPTATAVTTPLEEAADVDESGKLSLLLPMPLPPLDDSCLVPCGPPRVLLFEEWLPLEAEAQLLAILRSPGRNGDFVQLRGKRTARYGGDPTPPFTPEPLPPWLVTLCEALAASMATNGVDCHRDPAPNHVLVNHYQPGEGIMPHTDGSAYAPKAAILSLGSATVFNFWRDHTHVARGEGPEHEPPTLSLLLPPRSLLVFSEEAYRSHLHGIAARRYDDLDAIVANWTREEQARWAVPGAPTWAQQQLEPPPGEAWAEHQLEPTRLAGSLCRGERFSLTMRYVPPAAEE